MKTIPHAKENLMEKQYILKKDIIIPAGTKLSLGHRTTEYVEDPFIVDISFGVDNYGTFSISADQMEKLPAFFE